MYTQVHTNICLTRMRSMGWVLRDMNQNDELRISPVTKSAKIVNIHSVGDRTFHVYSHSICFGQFELLNVPYQVDDSCILGSTIALILTDGTVIIPHPKTLYDPDCPLIPKSMRLGMKTTRKKRIAGTRNGKYLIAGTTDSSATILEYITHTDLIETRDGSLVENCEDSIELKRLAIIRDMKGGHLQLTQKGESLIIWELSLENGTAFLTVRNFGLSGYNAPIIAEFPIDLSLHQSSPPEYAPTTVPSNISRTDVSRDSTRADSRLTNRHSYIKHKSMVQLFTLEPRTGPSGALIRINGDLIYISLHSIIIGDLQPGLKLLHSNILAMCQSRDTNSYELDTFVWEKDHILKFDLDSGNPVLRKVECKVPSSLFPNEIVPSSFKLAVQRQEVGYQEEEIENQEALQSIIQTNDKNIYRMTYAHKNSGKIHEFAIDTRKRPWKIVTLGYNSIKLIIPASPLKYVGKVSLKLPISTVLFEKELDLLLLSTIEGNTRLICDSKLILPAEIQGRILACGMLNASVFAIVLTDRIEYYQRTYSGTWNLHATHQCKNIVLSACIVSEIGCILQYLDKIVVVISPSDVRVILENSSVVYMTYNHDHEQLVISAYNVGGRTSENHIDIPSFKGGLNSGIVYVYSKFDQGGDPLIFTFKRPPTAIHFFHRDAFTAVFGNENPIYTLFRIAGNKKWSIKAHQVYGPVKLGMTSSRYAIYIGFGLHLVTPDGNYRRLYDNLEKSRGFISSVHMLGDDVIACVLKNDVRFFWSPLLGKSTTDLTLKQIRFPPPTASQNTNLEAHYHILLLSSLRILLLYRGTICNFYDSATLEPLLVSGLHVSVCSNVSLWNFSENGEVYEHLLFTDGLGNIESYALKREGINVECSIKYRAAAFTVHDSNRLFPEIVSSFNTALFIARRNQLTKVIPLEGKVAGIVSLDATVTSVSNVFGKFVIVTNASTLSVMTERLFTLSSIHTSDIVDCREDANFVCQTSTAIRGPDGHYRVIIICSMKSLLGDRHWNTVLEYKPESKTFQVFQSKFSNYRNDDLGLESIRLLPGYEDIHWQSNDRVVALGLSRDYRICLYQFPLESEGVLQY